MSQLWLCLLQLTYTIMYGKYTVRGKSKMQYNSLHGEIKISVVNDEHNAAQEIQIDVTNYVERTDLVLLG